MRFLLENELKKRGLRPNLSGTNYIREGVLYMLSRPAQPCPRMMDEVYPAIAKAANVDARAIEHAARYAVRKAGLDGPVSGVMHDIAATVRAYED